MGMTREQARYIERLYTEMYDSLCSYAYGILKNPHLAEEAAQETFQVACGKPADLISSKNPKGWLMKVLKNVLRNTLRRRATLEKFISEAESADIDLIADPAPGSNVDLMYSDMLTEAEFQLLKRVAIDQYTMLEAAEALGITVEACKKRVQRAGKKLRRKIEEIGVP
ncbi:MAG: sigma-70 family RNA polymerase sigma factor [Acutalibacter sp.]|nr:sigma-70 family RNA polymerase sigma factor [Acutalibacter sp.]